MQYNFHNEKYKMADIGGIRKEQFREYKDETKYKNSVDPDRSAQNMYQEMCPDGNNWYKQIDEAKNRSKEITGRAVRKDAVVLCSTVESVPASWDAEACREYFMSKADWYGKYLQEKGGADEKCLKSLVVHMDESTPHATYAWIPQMEGKLQAKNILTKTFLRDLQKDSQDFTFRWIDDWNSSHPDKQLEKLDPYKVDNGRQHLTELEFKEQKISDNLQSMKLELDHTQQKIGDLQKEKNELDIKTVQVSALKDSYEEKIEKLTGAKLPDYKSVAQENRQLRQELSFKDQIIKSLSEERDHFRDLAESWKSKALEWKEKFSDISHKAGQKLMSVFGYDVSKETGIADFPTQKVSEEIKEMIGDLKKLDPKSLRVIPDDKIKDAYRVVQKTGKGTYETVKGGFATRSAATVWRSNAVSAAIRIVEKNVKESFDVSKNSFR